MSSYLKTGYRVFKLYSPDAAKQAKAQPKRFGAFQATYYYPYLWRRPANDQEAQLLYNHLRTVAFWLDAAPLLTDLGLPFKVGIDDLVSLIPLYGDLASAILQLYQVFLSFLFGIDYAILGWMLLTVLIDTVVGIVPVLGDYLDYLFKANLRNLETLEEWLLNSPRAAQYHLLLMPASSSSHKAEFIPAPPSKSRFGNLSWGKGSAERAESVKRAGEGRTRRMLKDEGYAEQVPVPLHASDVDGRNDVTETAAAPEASAGRRRKNAGPSLNIPLHEPAF
ncbi:hypothetical protein QFC19_004464 [Naganishia cerealis]|uniref:Uncharacterized protein n=1 Tax=Naganishia cerealis TaxID=610337 RepID=A0ACC2VWX3_9TREE|nr:hypothetical protein QFC19_004464 [Naganishia cerealis]